MLPISERFNESFEKVLLKPGGDAEWDTLLQQLLFGYNKSKHISTKCFHFTLCMGGPCFERHT